MVGLLYCKRKSMSLYSPERKLYRTEDRGLQYVAMRFLFEFGFAHFEKNEL